MVMEQRPANLVNAADAASKRSSHPLRGDYSHIRTDYSVDQPIGEYSAAEHDRWRRLYSRQMELMPRYAAHEFLECIARLDAGDGIPNFARVNETLAALTGFQIFAVPGLIPDDVFFDHLANRRFPVSWWIREESELDYLEEPDVFHDFFGHVPLLAHPVFADYMVEYGKAGPRAKAMNAIPLLSRLYWYTIEFGLIRSGEGLRVYGAGILSSKGETVYAIDSDVPNRIAFDLERVLATEFRIDAYQETYFVIDSFEQLFHETHKPFAALYEKLCDAKPNGPGAVLATDRVIHRGTGVRSR
jgi:phenylalanine-4-hydroxylase